MSKINHADVQRKFIEFTKLLSQHVIKPDSDIYFIRFRISFSPYLLPHVLQDIVHRIFQRLSRWALDTKAMVAFMAHAPVHRMVGFDNLGRNVVDCKW